MSLWPQTVAQYASRARTFATRTRDCLGKALLWSTPSWGTAVVSGGVHRRGSTLWSVGDLSFIIAIHNNLIYQTTKKCVHILFSASRWLFPQESKCKKKPNILSANILPSHIHVKWWHMAHQILLPLPVNNHLIREQTLAFTILVQCTLNITWYVCDKRFVQKYSPCLLHRLFFKT